MSRSMKRNIGELANHPANDQEAIRQPQSPPTKRQKTETTEEKTDAAASFLCMPEPPSEHNVVRDMTPYFKSNPVEQTPQTTTPGTSAISLLVRADIGRFNPDYLDERAAGMEIHGRIMVFTDVDLFIEHIESFLQDPATAAAHERQIMQWLEYLLIGSAGLWWMRELDRVDRRLGGLSEVLADLERRFRLNPFVAAVKFEYGKLSLREIAFDRNRPMQFVQRKLRYARAMKRLDEENTEWVFVMLQVWFSMDAGIRAVLSPPNPLHTFDDYIEEIKQRTPDLKSRALKIYYGLVWEDGSSIN
ncbi:hypothetical protein F5Y00DRAFT_270925 [Daldinia vernicosa]|uniref:uncharacterized protein n=1 Tax=Daldinia vernicosa TaxID=114800 RepID=UPI002007637A|nr:uncharacterized protein F5Y00DRAFT_270925 [Daldinia vernicosa]KAI0847788.1 hypothetical protein F5Y00DRAFT_270925 [Daldinia vernicosa]